MKRYTLKLTDKDNVATAMEDIAAGDTVAVTDEDGHETETLQSLSAISRGHKIALGDIGEGEAVIKYGFAIGMASRKITKGELVHVENLSSARGRGDL